MRDSFGPALASIIADVVSFLSCRKRKKRNRAGGDMKKKLKNKIKIIDAERSGWNRLSTPFSVENLMERGHESYITAAIGRTGPSFFLSLFFEN